MIRNDECAARGIEHGHRFEDANVPSGTSESCGGVQSCGGSADHYDFAAGLAAPGPLFHFSHDFFLS
jgi:hypothetical protein